jgi:phage terminase large subunit-like protein
MEAYRDYRPLSLGIEKGMAAQAVQPYLVDEMKRLNIFFTITDLSHGNKLKADRIRWSMQGRAEKGRIYLKKGEPWVKEFISQSLDFPSQLGHDDLLDAVSYIDQLASTVYLDESDLQEINNWVPLDEIAGF